MQVTLAQNIIKICLEKGVKTFCICPGGRSAPFIEALSKTEVEKHFFFDERSAGFFALGRVSRDLRPVAVVTTSGTAASELLSSCIESHYSHLPCIFITCDRPKDASEFGVPQTIKDINTIFKPYVYSSNNLQADSSLDVMQSWKASKGSLHLNVNFDEPLIDGVCKKIEAVNSEIDIYPKDIQKKEPQEINQFFKLVKHPLLLIGELKPEEQTEVKKFIKTYPNPFYAEALSNLSSHPKAFQLGEKSLAYGLEKNIFDGVIRIGSVPRVKLWQNLENSSLPILNLSSPPHYPGIQRKSFNLPLWSTLSFLNKKIPAFNNFDLWFKKDLDFSQEFSIYIDDLQDSEFYWVKQIKLNIPNQSRVFLGNILPIRIWDMIPNLNQLVSLYGQNGTNGIDGLVSRFLGGVKSETINLALLGDLSTLYDMQAFWKQGFGPWEIIVLNNQGGQIFSRLFKNPDFLNSHDMNFELLAKFWKINYRKLNSKTGFFPKDQTPILTEIPINPEKTNLGFKKYDTFYR